MLTAFATHGRLGFGLSARVGGACESTSSTDRVRLGEAHGEPATFAIVSGRACSTANEQEFAILEVVRASCCVEPELFHGVP